MLNAIINDFTYELEESLAIEMLAIFLIKKCKTITIYGQKNISPQGHKKLKKSISKKPMFSL